MEFGLNDTTDWRWCKLHLVSPICASLPFIPSPTCDIDAGNRMSGVRHLIQRWGNWTQSPPSDIRLLSRWAQRNNPNRSSSRWRRLLVERVNGHCWQLVNCSLPVTWSTSTNQQQQQRRRQKQLNYGCHGDRRDCPSVVVSGRAPADDDVDRLVYTARRAQPGSQSPATGKVLLRSIRNDVTTPTPVDSRRHRRRTTSRTLSRGSATEKLEGRWREEEVWTPSPAWLKIAYNVDESDGAFYHSRHLQDKRDSIPTSLMTPTRRRTLGLKRTASSPIFDSSVATGDNSDSWAVSPHAT